MKGSTAKVAESQQLSSAFQHPLLWPPMEMVSTGPLSGGRPHPWVTLQPRASRPQQAQLAPTLSKSLLCDSSADGWNSTREKKREEEKVEGEEAGFTTMMDAPCPVSQGQQEEHCTPEEPPATDRDDEEHYWGRQL